MRVGVGKVSELRMQVNNELMIPNLSHCTNPASEPTAVLGPAGRSFAEAGKHIAALEENVYLQMGNMEKRMDTRLQTIETTINSNSAQIGRIATVISEIQASLAALTVAVEQVKVSINARGG